MPAAPLSPHSPATFHPIPGHISLPSSSPDGDSLRFIPSPQSHRTLSLLPRAHLLRPAADASLQLRLSAIDAPELHYRSLSQPLAVASRNSLLRWLGFTRVTYAAPSDRPTHAAATAHCTSSEPGSLPVIAVASSIDLHGRPIAYLFRAADFPALSPSLSSLSSLSTISPAALADAFDLTRNPALLTLSANHHQLARGAAYLLAYTSLPPAHRAVFRAAAASARAARRGVWADDATARGFLLRTLASIGETGALIFPKLFRRCVDYLTDRAAGFRGLFPDWLRARDEENAVDA